MRLNVPLASNSCTVAVAGSLWISLAGSKPPLHRTLSPGIWTLPLLTYQRYHEATYQTITWARCWRTARTRLLTTARCCARQRTQWASKGNRVSSRYDVRWFGGLLERCGGLVVGIGWGWWFEGVGVCWWNAVVGRGLGWWWEGIGMLVGREWLPTTFK